MTLIERLRARKAQRAKDREVRDFDGLESGYAPTGQDTYLDDLCGETVREVTGIRAIPWDMLR